MKWRNSSSWRMLLILWRREGGGGRGWSERRRERGSGRWRRWKERKRGGRPCRCLLVEAAASLIAGQKEMFCRWNVANHFGCVSAAMRVGLLSIALTAGRTAHDFGPYSNWLSKSEPLMLCSLSLSILIWRKIKHTHTQRKKKKEQKWR